jgi:hypothetical protein
VLQPSGHRLQHAFKPPCRDFWNRDAKRREHAQNACCRKRMESDNSCKFLCPHRTHIEQVGDARSDDSAKDRTAEEICKRSQHGLERGCGILRGLYRHGGDSIAIPPGEHAYQLDRTERPTLSR